MKNIFALITIISISLTSFSQSALELHYTLKVKPTSKAYKKVARQLNGGNMDFYITSQLFRMDVGFKKQMKTTTIIDMTIDSMVMIVSGEETGNLAYVGGFDAIKERNKKKKESGENKDPKEVQMETSETKKIRGYECVKTVYRSEGKTTIIWSTSSIKNPNETKGVVDGSTKIPVQFSVEQDGMLFMYTLKKTSNTLDYTKFNMDIPKGYKVNNIKNLK